MTAELSKAHHPRTLAGAGDSPAVQAFKTP